VLDAGDAARCQAAAGGGDRAVDVDSAAGILDYNRHEPLMLRVLGRPANAEVEGKANEEDAAQPRIRVPFHEKRGSLPGWPGVDGTFSCRWS